MSKEDRDRIKMIRNNYDNRLKVNNKINLMFPDKYKAYNMVLKDIVEDLDYILEKMSKYGEGDMDKRVYTLEEHKAIKMLAKDIPGIDNVLED